MQEKFRSFLMLFFSGSVFSLMNSALGLGETSLTMLTDDPVAMLVPLPNEGQAHHMFSPFLNLQIYDFFSKKFSFICTGKSLLEDINPVSTNPKYDKRLFIDLPI